MSDTEHVRHWPFRNSCTESLPPGPLAEELDLTLSTEALRLHMTHRKPAGLFDSAWSHIEYAMNRKLKVGDDIRRKYIGDARWLIGTIISSPRAELDVSLGALTLETFIPVLTKRALNQELDAGDCRDIYISLGNAMGYLTGKSLATWRMSETMLLALAARTGQPDLIVFPTSPREERSAFPRWNHDGYFIKDSNKIPIQQKMIPTDKEYDPAICMVEFLPIVNNALRRAGYSDYDDPYDALDYVLSAILAETTSDESPEPYEHELLNYLCRSIAARQRYSNLPLAA